MDRYDFLFWLVIVAMVFILAHNIGAAESLKSRCEYYASLRDHAYDDAIKASIESDFAADGLSIAKECSSAD